MTADDAINKAALNYLPATYRRAIHHLAQTPCSTEELTKHLGMVIGSGYSLIGKLRELGVIVIVDYRKHPETGGLIKVWGIGERRNATRPPKLTINERARRSRAKRKLADGSVRIGVWGL